MCDFLAGGSTFATSFHILSSLSFMTKKIPGQIHKVTFFVQVFSFSMEGGGKKNARLLVMTLCGYLNSTIFKFYSCKSFPAAIRQYSF